jgi:hypothetical protein
VVGHFYIAVLIGWLVGMFISEALKPCPEPAAAGLDRPQDS